MKYIVKIKDHELSFDYSEKNGKITNQNQNPLKYDFKELGSGCYSLILDGKSYIAHINRQTEGAYQILAKGQLFDVKIDDEQSLLIKQLTLNTAHEFTEQVIKAPIPGLVTQVFVKDGETLNKNMTLLTLEAMKMENVIKAPCDCTVEKVFVKSGDTVQQNQPLLELKKDE